MTSPFGLDGWGYEQLGLANDDSALTAAAHTAGIAVPEGFSPRAATAVFIAGARGGKEYAYIQHLHHMQWAAGENDLLALATITLTRALAADTAPTDTLGIEIVDDRGAHRVRELAETMKVPPPRRLGWTAAVVAVYVPNALGFPSDRWGVVQDRRACQYQLHELLTNAFLLVQNLRRSNAPGGGTYHR